jgi:hypothetical protein
MFSVRSHPARRYRQTVVGESPLSAMNLSKAIGGCESIAAFTASVLVPVDATPDVHDS